MRIAAQVDVRRLDLQSFNAVPDLAVIAVRHLDGICRNHGNLMIAQVDNLVGVADQRGSITGDEVLVVTDAQDQRTAQPRGDNHTGMIAKHQDKTISTAQLTQRGFDRLDERGMRFL